MYLKELVMKFNHSLGALILIAPLIAACTTTSDVIVSSEGTFSVSAKAAPAAGGISAASNLAIEKAKAHCEKLGKIAVKQNQRERALNAVGAGMSSVEFKCVPKFDIQQTAECYSKSRKQIISGFGEEFLDKLSVKLFPEGETFSFAQLGNANKPSARESKAISIYGAAVEECEALRITNFEPSAQRVLNVALTEELAALVKLSQGKTTFGEYAISMNEVNNKLGKAGAEIEANQRQQAAQARQLQMQGMSNLSNTIMNLRPTTCTSSYGGGYGTTTCY
ncbi:MAG: hypothetical protein ACON4W_09065 [Parvibaculales bacterium]